ncbi:hypothetical protein D3C75_1047730 [compost metagenome]
MPFQQDILAVTANHLRQRIRQYGQQNIVHLGVINMMKVSQQATGVLWRQAYHRTIERPHAMGVQTLVPGVQLRGQVIPVMPLIPMVVHGNGWVVLQ